MAQQDYARLAAVDPDLEGLKAAQDLLATDISNGRTALEVLARRGSVLAMLALATSFQRANPPNLLHAEPWFRAAYERGALTAFLGLVTCLYRRGELVAAENISTEGAARGDAVAMGWLAHLKLRRDMANLPEAVALLREAAAQGQVRASMQLAHLEIRGRLGLHLIPLGIARAIYTAFRAYVIGARDLDDRLLR
jgi:TPR repeat protein